MKKKNYKPFGGIGQTANEAMKKHFPVSLPAELAEKINTDSSESLRWQTIQIIETYFAILQTGRRVIRKTFSDQELNLIADICNGLVFEPAALRIENNLILIAVEDNAAIYGTVFFDKWQVPPTQIIAKIKKLDQAAQLALIDTIEKFWNTTPESIGDVFK